MKTLPYGCALSALVMASSPASGVAAAERVSPTSTVCCPGTDSTVQWAGKGLGSEHPAAADVSIDPNWRAYRFEREGIDYLQVNDLNGRVQVIVGRVEDLFWVLPAGDVPVEVSLPHDPISAPKGAVPTKVYQQTEFSLIHYSGTSGQWAIERPGSQPALEESVPKVCCPGDDHHNEIQARGSVVE